MSVTGVYEQCKEKREESKIKRKVVVRNHLFSFSPAGLAKASPPILHTGAFNWALAVPHLVSGHGFTPCLFLGIISLFSFLFFLLFFIVIIFLSGGVCFLKDDL